MTHQTTTPPPRTDPGLTRARDGAILGGVAAGLARRLDVSPSWIRLAFIVTAFFGGLGALLYVLAWALLPEDGESKSIAEDFMAGRSGLSAWVGGGLIVIALAVVFGAFDVLSFELLFAAILFLAGYLLYRGRVAPPPAPEEGPTVPPPAEPPPPVGEAPFSAGGAGTAPAPAAPPGASWVSPVVETYTGPEDRAATVDHPSSPSPPAPSRPAPPAAPPRPRSYLGQLTMAALLITVGVMALLQNAGAVDLALGDYVAAGVLVIGCGLLVGTFFGRARWLILVGLLAAPLLVATTAVRIPLTGEWGGEIVRPANTVELEAEYDHAVGQFILDLTDLELTEDTGVTVDQGIGQLKVIVPEARSLTVDAHVDAGAVSFFGDEEGGFDFDRSYEEVVAGEPVLHLDLEMGAGAIDVTDNSVERPRLPALPPAPFIGQDEN